METIFDYVLEQLYLEEKYKVRKALKKVFGKRRLRKSKADAKSALDYDKKHYKYVTKKEKRYGAPDRQNLANIKQTDPYVSANKFLKKMSKDRRAEYRAHKKNLGPQLKRGAKRIKKLEKMGKK